MVERFTVQTYDKDIEVYNDLSNVAASYGDVFSVKISQTKQVIISKDSPFNNCFLTIKPSSPILLEFSIPFIQNMFGVTLSSKEHQGILKFDPVSSFTLSGHNQEDIDVEFNVVTQLFSIDRDIEGIRSDIVSRYAGDSGNWIPKHELARDQIVQMLNNDSYSRSMLMPNSTEKKDITIFDLLDINQFRMASTYYAMSFIAFNELSIQENDSWERQGERYRDLARDSYEVSRILIDQDKDGVADPGETIDTRQGPLLEQD